MSVNEPSRLKLAVVGHTNTGKTSLLRTLTRNPDFGQVADSPGTTRHVEGVRLLVDGHPVIELFDTPGLEDGIGLLDYLDQLAQRSERLDGPDRIRRFLDTPESQGRFEQEARVLRKLLDCDAGLYVVDVRDPVLGKYKDELAILASCGRPLLPVLNFSHAAKHRGHEWRTALARLGLHAMVEFDTVAPPLDGETQLYDKLAMLLDTHAPLLQRVRDDVIRQRAARRDDAYRLVAELLIDAAALRVSALPDEAGVKAATETLRQRIRERENGCIRALLKRYNFHPDDYPRHPLPLEGERWGMDLFHPQALKEAGLHVTKGMAAGAMAGAAVDLFTAGMSLGAAALVGATAGGLWQGVERYGKRVLGRLQGYQELSVDDAVLRLLALRQMTLADALERRGHAAQGPIALASAAGDEPSQAGFEDALRTGKLPVQLAEARGTPAWSTLSDDYTPSVRRDQAVATLARQLSSHAVASAG